MLCNKCGGELINIIEGKDYIKKCNSCNGIMIIGDKLNEALGIAHEIEEVLDCEYNKKHHHVTKLQNSDEFVSNIKCHNCNMNMDNFEYMYSSEIRIDSCPACNSIWLDPGKLTKIKKYRHYLKSKKFDKKIKKILPKLLDIKREVSNRFQKIKEESNPFRSNDKK